MDPDELLRALFEAAPGSITAVDREGRILFMNRGENGRDLVESIGTPIYGTLPPAVADLFRDRIDAVFSNGQLTQWDYTVTKDGAPRWYRCRASPLRQHGHVVSVVIDSHETTDQKNTESELRQHERALTEAQRLAHLGSWSWDPDEDRFEWSGELARVLGRIPGQSTSHTYIERVHPKDRELVESSLKSAAQDGKPFELEHRVVLRDGAVRWLHVLGHADMVGERPLILGTAQDITEWKHAESANQEAYRRSLEVESLRSLNDLKTRLLDNLVEETTRRKKAEVELRDANDKLLDLVRFKAELLNVLSHELGNPLTPIKLQLHYLNTILGDDPGAVKSIEIMERNLARVINLSKDMLDVARLDAGRLRVERRALDLAMSVRESVDSFSESAKRAGLTLTAEMPQPLPVEADARRIEQVLFNLLSNAIKYTPAPGTVHVTAKRHGTNAVVEVVDSGLGFTPEQAARLFRPFSRLHEQMKGAGAGTGLGLYISKGIIDQHQGKMSAESAGPGKGARFVLEIPLMSKGGNAAPQGVSS